MTDAELDAIEQRYRGAEGDYYIGDCAEQILELVAEVRRYRTVPDTYEAFLKRLDPPQRTGKEGV